MPAGPGGSGSQWHALVGPQVSCALMATVSAICKPARCQLVSRASQASAQHDTHLCDARG
eukprot:2878835-Rhodomonas_salina.1